MRRRLILPPFGRLLLALCVAAGLGAPPAAAGPGGVMVICGAAGSYTVPFGPETPAPAHDPLHCALHCAAAAPACAPEPARTGPTATAAAPITPRRDTPRRPALRLSARGPPVAL